MNRLILACIFLIPFVNTGFAAEIYDGNGTKTEWNDLLSRIEPGTVVVFGDTHGYDLHHQNQRDFLVHISGLQNPISVGMEFFEFPQQNFVNQYMSGDLSESDFLTAINWGQIPFSNYRFQVRFPAFRNGNTLALNCPREISGKIASQGLESLTPRERSFLPADFTIGRDSYFERFSEVMRDHVPQEAILRYFTAHSAWDDTMAMHSAIFMSQNPEHTLVIIVGDFHVAYQDGLVARLRARGIQRIVSVSQVSTTGLNEDERRRQIQPHDNYGPRADFIFETE